MAWPQIWKACPGLVTLQPCPRQQRSVALSHGEAGKLPAGLGSRAPLPRTPSPTSSRLCLAAEERVLAGCSPALPWPKQASCRVGRSAVLPGEMPAPEAMWGAGEQLWGVAATFQGSARSLHVPVCATAPCPSWQPPSAPQCFDAQPWVGKAASARRARDEPPRFCVVFLAWKVRGAVTQELALTPSRGKKWLMRLLVC